MGDVVMMKKKETVQDIMFKNISGILGQYKRDVRESFMNEILEGVAVVNAVDVERERKKKEFVESERLLSETLEDLKEFQEYQQLKRKYGVVNMDDNISSFVEEE